MEKNQNKMTVLNFRMTQFLMKMKSLQRIQKKFQVISRIKIKVRGNMGRELMREETQICVWK